jgi:hypothetical protein
MPLSLRLSLLAAKPNKGKANMANDKELLELAAKAAGVDYARYEDRYGLTIYYDKPTDPAYWNPLTNDGDALRLVVKLELQPEFDNGQCLIGDNILEPFGVDKYAATRRAITRAAAEIGARI